MSMERYVTTRWNTDISAREITRETDKMVFYMATSWGRPAERKALKVSDHVRWHETWEAAHEYLLNREYTKLENARLALKAAQDSYGNVKGMKKPEEEA